jgi:hypothetical protein
MKIFRGMKALSIKASLEDTRAGASLDVRLPLFVFRYILKGVCSMFGGTRRFWLSRDSDGYGEYNLHLARRGDPKPIIDYGIYGNGVIESFCPEDLEELFPDCALPKGEIVRVKISIEKT